MKKQAALAAALAVLAYLAIPVLGGGNEDDLQVIKKAVQGGRSCESAKTGKWFKILITDHRSGSEIVKVALPISMTKLFAHCAKDKHRLTNRADRGLAAALKDLEELSPLVLLEVVDDDAKVKIWLE